MGYVFERKINYYETDRNLKPIHLKKYAPEFHEKFENIVEKT